MQPEAVPVVTGDGAPGVEDAVAAPGPEGQASTEADAAVEYLATPHRFRAWCAQHWSLPVSILIALGAWEIGGRMANPLLFAPFSETLGALWEITESGQLWSDLKVSGTEVAIGMLLGTVFGWAGAICSYVSKTFRQITDPWISALYTTPYVALTPLFIVWLGLGIASKVALVVLAAFIPTWLSAYTAVTSTDNQLKEVARAFDANWLQTFRHVVLPWALPGVITGFRLSLSRGIIAMVVGELMGGTAGIGVMIDRAGRTFDTPTLLAGILVLIIIAMTIIGALRWLQRKLVPWWDIQEQGSQ